MVCSNQQEKTVWFAWVLKSMHVWISTFLYKKHQYMTYTLNVSMCHACLYSMRDTSNASSGLRRHLSALINRDQHLIPVHCPSGREPHTHSRLMSLWIWLTAPLPCFSFSLGAPVYVSLPTFQFLSLYCQYWHFTELSTFAPCHINKKLHAQYVYKLSICPHTLTERPLLKPELLCRKLLKLLILFPFCAAESDGKREERE